MSDEPSALIVHAVHYQDVDSKPGEWYVMRGRDHNQRYEHAAPSAHEDETSSIDEAIDTAEALVSQRAFPHDPRSRFHRRVIASQVITRVYVGHVSAVYGTPRLKEDEAR